MKTIPVNFIESEELYYPVFTAPTEPTTHLYADNDEDNLEYETERDLRMQDEDNNTY